MASGIAAACLASRRDSIGQTGQYLRCCPPVDTAVRDALAVSECDTGQDILPACDQIALDHDAHDTAFSAGYLAGDIGCDTRLVLGLLVAVGVACVDHHARIDA